MKLYICTNSTWYIVREECLSVNQEIEYYFNKISGNIFLLTRVTKMINCSNQHPNKTLICSCPLQFIVKLNKQMLFFLNKYKISLLRFQKKVETWFKESFITTIIFHFQTHFLIASFTFLWFPISFLQLQSLHNTYHSLQKKYCNH